jgi:hypothetical protein
LDDKTIDRGKEYSQEFRLSILIKARMRAAKARTLEALERARSAALELITSADCLGWFRHCGYQVTPYRNWL